MGAWPSFIAEVVEVVSSVAVALPPLLNAIKSLDAGGAGLMAQRRLPLSKHASSSTSSSSPSASPSVRGKYAATNDGTDDMNQIQTAADSYVINRFNDIYAYAYNGDNSIPKYADPSSPVYGFQDFCIYDPASSTNSNIQQYILNKLNNGRINKQDASSSENAVYSGIQMQVAQPVGSTWYQYNNSFQAQSTGGVTINIDFFMVMANMTAQSGDKVTILSYACVYYHTAPFFTSKGPASNNTSSGRPTLTIHVTGGVDIKLIIGDGATQQQGATHQQGATQQQSVTQQQSAVQARGSTNINNTSQ